MKFMTKLETIIMNRTGCNRETANLVANDILAEVDKENENNPRCKMTRFEQINSWNSTIIEKGDKDADLKHINEALISIIEMTDTLTCDEQLDCIDALRKLRTKYQHIYKGGI